MSNKKKELEKKLKKKNFKWISQNVLSKESIMYMDIRFKVLID